MPSDVHIQHSAHLQQAQSKLHVLPSNSMLSDNAAQSNQSVYIERYKALREAGFDDVTANKYSSIYSSVNEVIDAILSQSLADHLVIENNQVKSGPSTNNGYGSTSDGVISNGQHQSAAGFNKALSTDLNTSSPAFGEKSSHSSGEATNFVNDSDHKQAIAALANEPTDLIAPHLKMSITQTDHLNGMEQMHESFKDRTGSSRLHCHSLDYNGHGHGLDDNDKLSELFGFNLFAASAHDLSGLDQFKSICEMADSNEDAHLGQLKCPQPSANFMNERHYLDSTCLVPKSGRECASFNRNLLATVLKDGLFDSDEIILEDEGVGEQNVASTSPSASSSLSSSGASSLLLDSSSSPSSFSSLSSSISTTPPNALNGFESSPAESGFGDSMFEVHFASKQLNCISQSSKPKFDPFTGSDHLDTNDLTRATRSKLVNGNCSNLGPITESGVIGSMDKSFLSAYSPETCTMEMNMGHGSYGSKNLSLQNHNLMYNELPLKYANESILSYPLGSLQSSADDHATDSNFANQSGQPNNFTDHFGKYLSQVSSDSLLNGKTTASEDHCDLLGYLNGNQMQHSLFDYDPSSRLSDTFGMNLDKLNKSAFDTNKTDMFGDFHFGTNKSNFSSFSECPESLFSAASPDSDLLGANSQSHYSTDFLNQRTFADIAASNVISSGPKAPGDHSLGAIGDCKLAKSSPLNCSNLSTSNGYFSLFASGANAPVQNSVFFEPCSHSMAKKSFCVPQSYRSPLSPMANKFGNGQLLNEQVNFGSQNIRSMNAMMGNTSSLASEMSSPVTCDGSSLNKPSNLMGYKGLWVCNISPEVTLAYLKRRFRRFGHFTGIQTFERRATNGSNIVFVHYDNPYSPVEAISCLHNYTGQDLCADASEPLKLRFAPSMEQSRAGQLPTLEQARKMVERHGECFNWRLSSGCHRGIRCQLKHVPINKEIDSQPWVKALKKKNNDL